MTPISTTGGRRKRSFGKMKWRLPTILGPEGNVLYANRVALEYTGLTLESPVYALPATAAMF
jgi:hypothetical protein